MHGRSICISILLLVALVGCRRSEQPPPAGPLATVEPAPLIRWHFAGLQTPQAEAARRTWPLLSEGSVAVRLRVQTLEKLARAPFRAWPARVAEATNDHAAVFRPMLEALAHTESFFEAHGDSNGFGECVLAVRLSPEQAEFWRTNLLGAFSDWSGPGATVTVSQTNQWELALQHPPARVRWVRAGEWVLLGWARHQSLRLDQLRARLSGGSMSAGPDTNAWLELFADLPHLPASVRTQWFGALARWFPGWHPDSERWPVVRLTLRPRGPTMRWDGELVFPKPISIALDDWQIPTELVRDPIVGFTAMRGVAGLFRGWFEALGLPTHAVPNQLYLWAGAMFPVQTLAAAPTPAAQALFQSAAATLPARFNGALSAIEAGAIELQTNLAGEVTLRWAGIPPFITPFLTVSAATNRTYLVAGLYPNPALPDATAPEAMFEHLSRQTNLVFYEWEFTGPRAYCWRAAFNVVGNILGRPRLGAEAAAVAFLNSLTNQPGNTVTEVRLVDSNRLALVREGPFVLSGAELVWLAHWLESPDFPFRLRVVPPAAETQP